MRYRATGTVLTWVGSREGIPLLFIAYDQWARYSATNHDFSTSEYLAIGFTRTFMHAAHAYFKFHFLIKYIL